MLEPRDGCEPLVVVQLGGVQKHARSKGAAFALTSCGLPHQALRLHHYPEPFGTFTNFCLRFTIGIRVIHFNVGKRGTTFTVRIVPRASASEIVGEQNGALKIRIAAPPVEGAANRELVRLLSRTFKLPKSLIEIVSGANAKIKIVRLGDTSAAVLDRLRAW